MADITYIRTRSGWVYLAVVLDLFARKVVGWAMAPSMQATLVCRALQLAIVQRQSNPEWRLRGLYQLSIQVNTAKRASVFVFQVRRAINSHSKLAKKLSAIALS